MALYIEGLEWLLNRRCLMNLRELEFEVQINKLAEALQNPASVHGRRNHDGYVCLSEENANWHLCARVAHSSFPWNSMN